MPNIHVPRLTVAPPHYPQGDQLEYYHASTRFTIARIGRQYGKSLIARLRMLKRVRANGRYWFVLPTIKQARSHWLKFKKDFAPLFSHTSDSYREATIRGMNAVIGFKGADSPETLEGESLNGVILDEAARLKPNVWDGTIRPMLSVAYTKDPTDGWADLIGKPRGKNHFFRQWAIAQEHPDWTTFHRKSYESPFFSRAEYDDLQLTTPSLMFQQEYDAEFIEDGAGAFSGVRDCIAGELHDPIYGHRYSMGVDLAKYRDWTVIIIIDLETNHVCHFQRFNKMAWATIRGHIVNAALKYDAQVKIDATGVGDPVVENLEEDIPGRIIPVTFNNENKGHMVTNLVLKIEQQRITYPDIDELINELTLYEPSFTKSGKISYSAPDGYHDDCVTALFLAADGTGGRTYEAQPY